MTLFAFILNGVILVLLGAMIFFAVKLSLALRSFRDNRAELRDLIESLSRAILQADGAIRGLREAAREGGRDLQGTIGEARGIQDELRIMIESGDSLARRIESAVDRGRSASYKEPQRDRKKDLRRVERLRSASDFTPPAPPAPDGFSIRDPDYDRREPSALPDIQEDAESGHEGGDERFYSKAERELYEALQKKSAGGGRGA